MDESCKMKIHQNWVLLLDYCSTSLRNGMVCFTVKNAIPVRLLSKNKRFKFGSENQQPKFIKNVDANLKEIVVTQKWKGLLDFARDYIPYGQITVKLAKGEPTEPVLKYCSQNIVLDHPETFPKYLLVDETKLDKANETT
jgi:hypothetical protein